LQFQALRKGCSPWLFGMAHGRLFRPHLPLEQGRQQQNMAPSNRKCVLVMPSKRETNGFFNVPIKWFSLYSFSKNSNPRAFPGPFSAMAGISHH
jgi:hypothetical protein